MKLGVPKETAEGERRVAIVPETVEKLRARGLDVLVEAGAGREYNLDSAYEAAGARVVRDAGEVYAEADIVAKVQRPSREEAERMRDGTLLVSFLQPHGDPELVRALAERGVSAFSMELIPRIARAQSMDALSSMSSIGGYKASLIAAADLGKYLPMMTTAAGTTRAAKVLILGAGVAGLQAIATCRRLGAEVTAFDIRPEVKEQIESLGASFLEAKPEREEQAPAPAPEEELAQEEELGLMDRLREAFGLPPKERVATDGAAERQGAEETEEESASTAGGYAREQTEDKQRRDREMIKRFLSEVDVVITTALVPGRPAPKLLTADMVDEMPPGSLVVDLAAEAGGNCELTRPGEVVDRAQVRIHGPLNLPSSVPIHASQMFSRNVLNVLTHLLDDEGGLQLDFDDEITDQSVLTHGGEVRHGPTREALGLPERQAT
jgi:H+-translocating NAD(P) transhydrogenase subunit alpha